MWSAALREHQKIMKEMIQFLWSDVKIPPLIIKSSGELIIPRFADLFGEAPCILQYNTSLFLLFCWILCTSVINFKQKLVICALWWHMLICPTHYLGILFEVSLALGNNLKVLTSKPRINPPNGHPTVG